jgi:hypothetical protein
MWEGNGWLVKNDKYIDIIWFCAGVAGIVVAVAENRECDGWYSGRVVAIVFACVSVFSAAKYYGGSPESWKWLMTGCAVIAVAVVTTERILERRARNHDDRFKTWLWFKFPHADMERDKE